MQDWKPYGEGGTKAVPGTLKVRSQLHGGAAFLSGKDPPAAITYAVRRAPYGFIRFREEIQLFIVRNRTSAPRLFSP